MPDETAAVPLPETPLELSRNLMRLASQIAASPASTSDPFSILYAEIAIYYGRYRQLEENDKADPPTPDSERSYG